jgi:molybdopterin-guanine dinucleotide biosynthesis protein A
VTAPPLAGIFVGGASSRMGGSPKGLLAAPGGGTLVTRWLGVLRAAGVADVVLVGRDGAYADVPLPALDDAPRGIGPLGGVVALLRHAGARRAIAVACDMPFVSPELIGRLVAAPDAPVVAPRRDERWEPLCARYDSPRVLPLAEAQVARGVHSLQRLLDGAGAQALPIAADAARELRDWDSPEDIEP